MTQPHYRGDRRTGTSYPRLPDDISLSELDEEVRRDLRALPKELADWVGAHLVQARNLVESDPGLALRHAQAARAKASRLAVVREAAGIAAYYAGEWQTALSELRAARRMSGSDVFLPVIVDCERALGKTEKAWATYTEALTTVQDKAVLAELTIVAAGIRRDADDLDQALALLQPFAQSSDEKASWLARARYAYADTLLQAGDVAQAREWLTRAADVDAMGDTDAAERLLALDGFEVTEFNEDEVPETTGSKQ